MNRYSSKWFFIALLLNFTLPLTSLCTSPSSFSGKVVRIIDGDSIEILHNQAPERVRLYGIDCPERRQAFGTAARKYTADLVFEKVVNIDVKGKDQYGRTLGIVHLPDGRILNRELVRAGMAWWYRKHSRDNVLKELELEAKKLSRGLWIDHNPLPPWKYRKADK